MSDPFCSRWKTFEAMNAGLVRKVSPSVHARVSLSGGPMFYRLAFLLIVCGGVLFFAHRAKALDSDQMIWLDPTRFIERPGAVPRRRLAFQLAPNSFSQGLAFQWSVQQTFRIERNADPARRAVLTVAGQPPEILTDADLPPARRSDPNFEFGNGQRPRHGNRALRPGDRAVADTESDTNVSASSRGDGELVAWG